MSAIDTIEVSYPATKVENNTMLITVADYNEWSEAREAQILKSALETWADVPQSSVIPTDDSSSGELTLADIDLLAKDLNSNLDNLRRANAVILQKILEDAFLGQAYESVVANINTDYKLTYGVNRLTDEDKDELEIVKKEIDFFNSCVNLKQLIRDAMARTYAEGNAPMVLRITKDRMPVIEIYPLSIAYPSEYKAGGRSVLEFNLKELRNKLKKTYKKSKKTKRAIYFEDMLREVQNNYSTEIYLAYQNNEDYVRIDPRFGDCVKINDLGRRFGVSPLFRCLRPLIVLNQIEAADVSDSQARSKKILLQTMRKELLGNDGTRKAIDVAAYAHAQATAALKTKNCVYTAIAPVEDLKYVQIKNQSDESINQQKEYTEKLMTGLGIGFTDIDATVGAATISIGQLLKLVNAIGENLETVLNKFYTTWVVECGHDPRFAPTIRVIDAEQTAIDMRKELASFVYSTLGGSRKTAMSMLDLDYDDERLTRLAENQNGDDGVFYARETSYTVSGNNTGGRPSGEPSEKQAYDEVYNETRT